MTTPVADASVYTDLNGLSALKRDARAQDPATLRKVAQQFESIFAKMVLTSMRQATSSVGDSLTGSTQTEFYQGMFDDQLSIQLTKGKGLGLADMLVQQLTRSGLVKPDAAKGASATTIGGDATTGAPGAAMRGNASQSDAAGALTATEGFISKMLSGNAQAADIQQWKAGSPEEFVAKLWPCAQAAGKELGVDPKHLLAQAALETGWGKSLPCDPNGDTSFNFFGIKATGDWQGDSVTMKTLEFEGGLPVQKQAKFRAYDSPADSFRDYVSVLRDNPRYAEALNTGKDAHAFASALQRGGYATDPAYATKIAAIAHNLPISETALKSSGEAPIPQPIDLF
ncbi:MAG: flagellar assembly peptidoglycan hydrolase FlgJ, partial [Gammaproteobacteria bacterium]